MTGGREENGVRYQVRSLPRPAGFEAWDAVCEVWVEGGLCDGTQIPGRWAFYGNTPGALCSAELAGADGERMMRDAIAEYRTASKMNAYERMMSEARPGERGGEIVDERTVEMVGYLEGPHTGK